MAKVYVGTYKKYNNGDISGQWINLADCATYADFLAKCQEAHKDERDPEYMIQDCADMPDGLSILESLSEEDFNDIKLAMKEEEDGNDASQNQTSYNVVDYSEKAIAVTGDTRPLSEKFKAIGGRFNPRLSCGAGWIFPKTKESAVREILKGSAVAESKRSSAPKEDGAQFKQEYLTYVEQMQETEYWKDYYRKRKDLAVKLQDGWLIIDKPSIENKFCFHDEGPQYEFYKKLMANESSLQSYFLSENLASIDREIENLKKADEPLYTRPLSNNAVEVLTHRDIYGYYDYLNGKKEARQITKEERADILTAYGIVRAEFEKRLQSYLKRYGVSKLHVWTYWADR